MTTPHSSSSAHPHTPDAWVGTGQNDMIAVPRPILVRLLTHVVAGNKRFPTRHLSQAIQMLNRILGTP